MGNQSIPTQCAISQSTVTLDNCDREQVQHPGAIQPHGMLLVLQEPELSVLQISANVESLFGIAPESLLGQNLSGLLGDKDIELLEPALAELTGEMPHQRILRLNCRENASKSGTRQFDVFAHRQNNLLILELELVCDFKPVEISNLYGDVRRCLANLQNTPSIQQFLDTVVEEVRQLIGFDRVHVYQFLDDWSGLVRAESKSADHASYLGLHFPANDVPEPARRLLSELWFRYLPDVAYQPVPLIPELNPLTGGALDLGHALLRSTSPLCNRFYLNMGVRSTLTLTLLKDGELWGFIACHHPEPKFVPSEIREACESLAHMVSLLMTEKGNAEEIGEVLSTKSAVEQLIESMSNEYLLHHGLLRSGQALLKCVDAQGAAMIVGEGLTLLGVTPDETQIGALAHWLSAQDDVFATDRLAELYPPADDYIKQASGLLSVRLPDDCGYLIWFRPEQIQEVRWAGNPIKPIEAHPISGLDALGPRRSFELWQETVHGRSRAWKNYQLNAASQLERAMRTLHRAERLARNNQALVRDNEELESFAYTAAHDLKEPLRGIDRFSKLLRQDLRSSLPEDQGARLEGILRLTHRMNDLIDALLNYSRLGKVQLNFQSTDLNRLVRDALDSLPVVDEAKVEITIKEELPTLQCNPVQMRQLFINLITNAIKYNNSEPKRIEIGVESNGERLIYVKDNGIGIAPEFHQTIFEIFRRLHGRDAYGGGTGVGLSIAKKIVALHGGRIWVESVPGDGSTFFISLPNSEGVVEG